MRPSPEEPHLDVASFITKVRFFLHPDFAPNDVIEIVKPPFSLRRRGWGEFPLRVQLHFKYPQRNRAVDVIHHLKVRQSIRGPQAIHSLRCSCTPRQRWACRFSALRRPWRCTSTAAALRRSC